MFKRFTIGAIILLAIAVPATAQGAIVDFLPLVPCGGYDGATTQPICNPCHIFQTFNNVINLILFGITGPVAAFMVVIAGGMMLLSAGDTTKFQKGRRLLTNTLIGVAIILAAWLVTNTLINTLGGGTTGGRWYEFSCPADLARITNNETQFLAAPALPTPPPAATLQPGTVGVVCPDSSLNLCAPPSSFQCGTCPKYQTQFSTYASGRATAGLLESIMFAESSCGTNTTSFAGAYGHMQMKPDTARRIATPTVVERCKLYVQAKDPDTGALGEKRYDNIDPGFLSQTHTTGVAKVVCLAAEYINSIAGACGSDTRTLAAGYNGGPGACGLSTACAGMPSCAGGPMRRWECLWENTAHTSCNANRKDPITGLPANYKETRGYAPKVAACAR